MRSGGDGCRAVGGAGSILPAEAEKGGTDQHCDRVNALRGGRDPFGFASGQAPPLTSWVPGPRSRNANTRFLPLPNGQDVAGAFSEGPPGETANGPGRRHASALRETARGNGRRAWVRPPYRRGTAGGRGYARPTERQRLEGATMRLAAPWKGGRFWPGFRPCGGGRGDPRIPAGCRPLLPVCSGDGARFLPRLA